MISKRPLSQSQRIALRMVDAAEFVGGNIHWVLVLGASLLTAALLHNKINNHIQNNCNRLLYQVVETPTAFGPAYSCISRVQKQGPAPTFKD